MQKKIAKKKILGENLEGKGEEKKKNLIQKKIQEILFYTEEKKCINH